MRSISLSSVPETPPPVALRVGQVRRRIVASDSVAALVAELAFGPPRDGVAWVWPTSVAEARQ